jgi:hypothetical protein
MNGNVTITGFKNNYSSSLNGGGGVYVSDGTFNMNGGTIVGNSANYGGGLYLSTGTNSTMSGDSIIEGNSAVNYGGGVFVNGGNFTMSGGTIYGLDAPAGHAPNTANGTQPNGGAVYVTGTAAKYGGDYAGKGYGSGASGNDITTTSNTLPPAPSAVITITFAQISDASPNITGPTLSRTETGYPKNTTLTIGSGYTDISWEITGTGFTGPGITGTGVSFTLDATDSRYNQDGEHHLTLTVKKDGVPYNKTIIFKIVN